MKVAFVGPPVTIEPEKVAESVQSHRLRGAPRIRLSDRQLCQGHSAVRAARRQLLEGRRRCAQSRRRRHRESGRASLGDESLQARSGFQALQRSVSAAIRYISFYTTRGCPAMCTFCLWPQTHSGHRWRLRSSDDVAAECKYTLENFPGSRKFSSTTTPSTIARPAPSSCRRSWGR